MFYNNHPFKKRLPNQETFKNLEIDDYSVVIPRVVLFLLFYFDNFHIFSFRCLTKNSNAVIELELSRPICIELYKDYKDLGRFMLRNAGSTIAAGVVTEVGSTRALL